VHETVVAHKLFRPGERVAIGASGGKDSTVLAAVLSRLNARHHYGLDLFLLSVDEGIAGYRDDSLEAVRKHSETFGMPLTVVSYKQLYGWSMDEVVRAVGTRGNCTYCGVLRRQALDRGAAACRADKVATGHNADDAAETLLLNLLRGDVARLGRTAAAETGAGGPLPRVKPLRCAYEKEVVAYAYFAGLAYFSTECAYAPFAARGLARDFVKDLEAARPSAIADMLHSAETLRVVVAAAAGGGGGGAAAAAAAAKGGGGECVSGGCGTAPSGGCLGSGKGGGGGGCQRSDAAGGGSKGCGGGGRAAAAASSPSASPTTALTTRPKACVRCGYMTSQQVCKACVLLEGLNKGRARVELVHQ
jgi:cytoplasmic tRNA 2-thiolation protein 1